MAVAMNNGVSGMLHRVAPVRTDVSEELSASIIKVTRIGELGTLAVTSNRHAVNFTVCRLLVTALSSTETLVLTRATQRNIPEDAIEHFCVPVAISLHLRPEVWSLAVLHPN
jgi:hypothetical protein